MSEKDVKKKTAASTSASNKKVATKKTSVAKEKSPSPVTKKVVKKKPASSKPTMFVQQVRSPVGREKWQRQVLIGLGLNKMHRTRELEDTQATRGMVAKVSHLVNVVSK